MRLATVISLLLFASTACALQQRHDERRDGIRSSSIRRRSLRPISRRGLRLASRRIASSLGSGIVPRGSSSAGSDDSWEEVVSPPKLKPIVSAPQSLPESWTPKKVYDAWRNARKNHETRPVGIQHLGSPKASRVMLSIDGTHIQLIVEETRLTSQIPIQSDLLEAMPVLARLKRGVTRLRNGDNLYGVLFDGLDFIVLRKDPECNTGTLTRDEAVLKNRHYCGISGWTSEDLPIFDIQPKFD